MGWLGAYNPDGRLVVGLAVYLRNDRGFMKEHRRSVLHGCSVMVILLAGCRRERVGVDWGLQSIDPGDRVAAIVRIVETGDRTRLGEIVCRLEDEDAAVRFAAIVGLERMTGTRRGCGYGGDAFERTAGVARWRRYLREMMLAAETDASSVGGTSLDGQG
jgi:hypothetical protein